LSPEDIEIIKNRNLTILTPSQVSIILETFMLEDLANIMQDKISKQTNVKMSVIEKYKLFIYLCWTWVNPVILFSTQRSGYNFRDDLELEVYRVVAFTHFLDKFNESAKKKISNAIENRMLDISVELPKQFDIVLKQVGTNDASQLMVSEKICKLILNHKVDLVVQLELYGNIWIRNDTAQKIFSDVFIVPEEATDIGPNLDIIRL
jgi:hypothetical protein